MISNMCGAAIFEGLMGYALTISGNNPAYSYGETDTITGSVSWGATDPPSPSMEGKLLVWDDTAKVWNGTGITLGPFTVTGTGNSRSWSVPFTAPSSGTGLYGMRFAGTTAGQTKVVNSVLFDIPKELPPPPPVGPVRIIT